MARTEPFDRHYEDYERWFEAHGPVYQSEVAALRDVVPSRGHGLEVGVGTGRFAMPLGVDYGVDPSREMRRLARLRGVEVVGGVGESLPFVDALFDYALVVTTICFVDDARRMFEEIRRILVPDGVVIVGLVDRDSPLGREYDEKKERNPFYRVATFYSTAEVRRLLDDAGFDDIDTAQTVFGRLADVDRVQEFIPGHGDGGFVVIRASAAGRHTKPAVR